MKIILHNETKITHYVFNDSDAVVLEESRITTPTFIIADLNSSNATLVESVNDVPEDWENDKYIYDDAAEPKWSLILPEEEPVSEEQISEEPVVEEAPTDA